MGVEPAPTVEGLAFAPGRPLGEGLKAAREHLGLSLDDVADATKVRLAYLRAIESADLPQLPSRPFTEGYVRAYAAFLGLDEGRAIGRLRQDWPLENLALPEPVGVSDEADPRIAVFLTAGALVILAIVIWNIAQRAMADREPKATTDIAQAAPLPPPPKAVVLDQPLPPPPEATLPAPYIPPGLEVETPAPAEGTSQVSAPSDDQVRLFQAKGRIYGAPAGQSFVTLQAVANVFIILRGRGDSVQQIQELKTGEAYRAPMGEGLAIDVTAPSAVEVYVGGVYRGRLTQSVTQLSALARLESRQPAQTPIFQP